MKTRDEGRIEDQLRVMYRDVAGQTPPLGSVPGPLVGRSAFRTYGVLALAAAAAAVIVIGAFSMTRGESNSNTDPAADPSSQSSVSGTTASLVGTWLATSLGGTVPEAGGRYEPRLILRQDGTFTAYDSCITANGTYDSHGKSGGTLTFTYSQTRPVLCRPHYAHPFDASRFRLSEDGAELELFGPSGSAAGIYDRQDTER